RCRRSPTPTSMIAPKSLNLGQIDFLTLYCILLYTYCVLRYETGRENSLSPRGGRLSARAGTSHDPTGTGGRRPQRAGQKYQPVVYLADRERIAAAHDAIVPFPAG